MTYVREQDGGMVVAVPPKNAGPKALREYLAEVRREIDDIIASHSPREVRHRIDLANGRRGGYFSCSPLAVRELLTETLDAAH